MSFIGRIFGAAAGETVKGLAEGIGGLAISLRSAITGEASPETQAKLEELAIIADQLASQGQAEINKMEAQHKSIFVAGWRPFIGWICGLAIGWHFLVHPFFLWGLAISESTMEPPPLLDLAQLYPVVLGMLGLGLYRTYEKKHDVQDNH